MFENIMHPPQQQQQVAVQEQQYPQQGYYDPYQLPIDPYMQQRPTTNWNKQMMDKLFDPQFTPEQLKGDFNIMFRILISDLRRIPNINPTDKRRLIRNYADIQALNACDGTEEEVQNRLMSMYVEISSQTGDGSNALNGLTGVSAMITQKSEMTQQVKIPQQPERKKIFGLI